MWEPADVTRSLIVGGFLLRFIARVDLFAIQNSLFACHSTCVTSFSLVRLVHLIFSSAAEPGADRWLSMVTSTIDHC